MEDNTILIIHLGIVREKKVLGNQTLFIINTDTIFVFFLVVGNATI
jgi:hypothetical protein